MQIDGLSFVFLFFPICFASYYLVPTRFQNAVLFGFSLLFYFFAQPTSVLVLLLSVYFDFAMAKAIDACDYNRGIAKIPLFFSIVKNVGLIVCFSVRYQITGVAVPLGMAIHALTSLWYVIDFYKGNIPLERNFIDYGVFCLFFPKLYAGPVTEYIALRKQIKEPARSLSKISDGMVLFIQGLAKKVILADGLSVLYQQTKQLVQTNLTTVLAWTLVLSFGLSMYYNLSSLCDMARGLGKVFGMDLPINFYYPFQSRSIVDFFHRFNITVNKFIRKNVYLTLGEDKNGVLPAVFNTFLLGLLMGLWYEINLNYMIWGIYFSVFILLERYAYGRLLQRIPAFFSRMYTLCVVLLSFSLLAGGSWHSIVEIIAAMFTAKNGVYDDTVLYVLSSNYTLLIVSAVGATSFISMLSKNLQHKRPTMFRICQVGFYVVLLIVTVSFML